MMGSLLALGSAACFSLCGILIRRSGNAAGPLAGLVLLLVMQALLSLSVFLGVGGAQPLTLGGAGWFLLAGVLTGAVGNILFIACVRNAGPTRASATKVAALVLGMAAPMWLFGERMSVMGWVGTGLVLLGLWAVGRPDGSSGEGSLADYAAGDGGGGPSAAAVNALVRRGVIAGLAAGLAFTTGNLIRKVAVAHWPEPVGGAILESIGGMAVALLVPRTYAELGQVQWRRAGYLLGAGAASAAGIIAFLGALHYIPLSSANLLSGVEPVITLLLGLLLFPTAGRSLRLLSFGVLAVTVGVLLVVGGNRP